MVELDAVRQAVEPLVAGLGLELVDVEVVGAGRARTLRLTLDREGGIDLDGISMATEVVSPAVDAVDPFDGAYTLEVSSPGVERPLHHPADFRRFAGTEITVKTHEPVDGTRRLRGRLLAAGDDGIDLDVDGRTHHLAYDGIAAARTVFQWGPAPKPGAPRPGGRTGGKKRA